MQQPLIRRRAATPFPPRGRLDVRKGEGLQRPLQSAEADSFPDGEAKNAGCV